MSDEFKYPFHDTYYVPIQMTWGTTQTAYMRITAQQAWKSFLRATGMTKEQAKKEGYKVKKVQITIPSMDPITWSDIRELSSLNA